MSTPDEINFNNPVDKHQQVQDYVNDVLELSKKAFNTQKESFSMKCGKINIQLLFSSHTIIQAFTRSVKHLEIEQETNINLTIYCWDKASTGISPPFIPWVSKTYITTMETPYYSNNGFFVLYKRESQILYLMDKNRGVGICWTLDANGWPYYEKASPLRTMFQWAVLDQDSLCIHSAGVAFGNKGILMTGTEKSGKSTTSLMCMLNGMRFAGDDYIILNKYNNGYAVYSLYSSAKLSNNSLRILPELNQYIENHKRQENEKVVFYFYESFPDRIIQSFSVSAVLLPVITGRKETSIKPATSAEGIKALAPTTIFLQPGERKAAFSFLARFVKEAPCYLLELGTDYHAIPQIIRKFLRSI